MLWSIRYQAPNNARFPNEIVNQKPWILAINRNQLILLDIKPVLQKSFYLLQQEDNGCTIQYIASLLIINFSAVISFFQAGQIYFRGFALFIL